MIDPKIQDAFEMYIKKLKKRIREYYLKNYPMLDIPEVHYKKGRKWWAVREENHAHSFVDMETGDIFKPATYRAPAKHARGNILSPYWGMEALNPNDYYVRYLR